MHTLPVWPHATPVLDDCGPDSLVIFQVLEHARLFPFSGPLLRLFTVFGKLFPSLYLTNSFLCFSLNKISLPFLTPQAKLYLPVCFCIIPYS